MKEQRPGESPVYQGESGGDLRLTVLDRISSILNTAESISESPVRMEIQAECLDLLTAVEDILVQSGNNDEESIEIERG